MLRQTRSLFFPLALTLLTQGCCPIPIPRTYTLQYNTQIRVLDPNGKPLEGVDVIIARRYADSRDDVERRWTKRSDARGQIQLRYEEKSEWIMPLMMHGIPFYAHVLCLQREGLATRIEPLMPRKGLRDKDDRQPEDPLPTLTVTMQPGSALPCPGDKDRAWSMGPGTLQADGKVQHNALP